MDVIWNGSNRPIWDDFHRRHQGSLQQCWAYGEALKTLGVQVHRAVVSQNNTVVGLAQFSARRLAGYVYVASCARGPVWSDALDSATRNTLMRRLKRSLPARPWRATVFSPDRTAEELPAAEVRGLHRVMSGYATVELDLRQDLEQLRAGMEVKWRNRLNKALADASMQVFIKASERQCERLLAQETEQRQARGFHGLPTGFVKAFIAAHERPEQGYFVAWAHHRQDTVAAMLVLLHGAVASYHMGWSNEDGRRLNAHNRLLWASVEHLKRLGLERFDLGGLNTRTLPGISRFKLGTGGAPRVLAGTYF